MREYGPDPRCGARRVALHGRPKLTQMIGNGYSGSLWNDQPADQVVHNGIRAIEQREKGGPDTRRTRAGND